MRDHIPDMPSEAVTPHPAFDVRARFEAVTALVTMARIEDVIVHDYSAPNAARDAATVRYVNHCDAIIEAYGALIDDGLVVQHVIGSALHGDPAPMLVDVPTIPKAPRRRTLSGWWVLPAAACGLGVWIGFFYLIGAL